MRPGNLPSRIWRGVDLAAGEDGLLRVDHDYVIAHVDVRGVGGLVLAPQMHGYEYGKTTDDEALGVDQHPLLLDLAGLSDIGFHQVRPLVKHAKARF